MFFSLESSFIVLITNFFLIVSLLDFESFLYQATLLFPFFTLLFTAILT